MSKFYIKFPRESIEEAISAHWKPYKTIKEAFADFNNKTIILEQGSIIIDELGHEYNTELIRVLYE